MEVYNHSAATLNLHPGLRHRAVSPTCARCTPGTQDFVRNSGVEVRYEALAARSSGRWRFMVACGVDNEAFRTVDFYSSHEALLLDYEHALTRIDSRTGHPVQHRARTWSGSGSGTRQLGRRARRVPAAPAQPDRGEARPVDHAGRRGRARRARWTPTTSRAG